MVGQNKFSKVVVIIGFLFPSLAGLFLFQLIPMLSSAVISFTNWDLLTPAKFVGVDNYTEALQDEKTLTSLMNIHSVHHWLLPICSCFWFIVRCTAE